MNENLDFYCSVTMLWLLFLKNDVNVPSKRNKQKNLGKNYIWLASCGLLMKRAGSGARSKSASGSVSKRYGSDPRIRTRIHNNMSRNRNTYYMKLTRNIVAGSSSVTRLRSGYRRCWPSTTSSTSRRARRTYSLSRYLNHRYRLLLNSPADPDP